MERMRPDEELSARALAERADTTVRTVHYYVSEGLLPPPQGTTRNAVYRDTHLARLRVIAALRAEGLSLAAIRARLTPLGDDGVREVLETLERFEDDIDAGNVSALGLIEAAVVDQSAPESSSPPMPSEARLMMSAAPPPHAEQEARGSAREYVGRMLLRQSPEPQAARPTQQPSEPPPAPETWHHFAVDEGIEIRIREDRVRPDRRRIDAFVQHVREQARRDLRRQGR